MVFHLSIRNYDASGALRIVIVGTQSFVSDHDLTRLSPYLDQSQIIQFLVTAKFIVLCYWINPLPGGNCHSAMLPILQSAALNYTETLISRCRVILVLSLNVKLMTKCGLTADCPRVEHV